MDKRERALLRKYLYGYRLYADLNGQRHEVLYSSRHDGDPMPWISVAAPELRFINDVIRIQWIKCAGCGAEIGPRPQARRDLPPITVCESCAVAELYGDLVQIEKGTFQ